MKQISRNAPCPCGSGKKHHECCQPLIKKALELHRLDQAVFAKMDAFVRAHLPPHVISLTLLHFSEQGRIDEETLMIAVPWLMHFSLVDGRPPREHFLAGNHDLEAHERAWLEAHRAGWLSVWEVVEVQPGLRAVLRDRLTGERRVVYERSATQGLLPSSAVLCRVLEFDGTCVMVGAHMQPLLPWGAQRVVEEMYERLGDDLTVERLRGEEETLTLIELWNDTVSEMKKRPLMQLANTDGEELVIVSQRWKHEQRGAVLEALCTLPDVVVEDGAESTHLSFQDHTQLDESSSDSDDPFALLSRLGRTVGFATVTGNRLELMTNSRERADRLGRTLEVACGPLLSRLHRSVSTLEELAQLDLQPTP